MAMGLQLGTFPSGWEQGRSLPYSLLTVPSDGCNSWPNTDKLMKSAHDTISPKVIISRMVLVHLNAWLVAPMLWFAGITFNFSSCTLHADFWASSNTQRQGIVPEISTAELTVLKGRSRHSWKCDYKCAVSLCPAMWEQWCRNPWMHRFCLCSGVSDMECWSSAHIKRYLNLISLFTVQGKLVLAIFSFKTCNDLVFWDCRPSSFQGHKLSVLLKEAIFLAHVIFCALRSGWGSLQLNSKVTEH